jgi:hypothetical protein
MLTMGWTPIWTDDYFPSDSARDNQHEDRIKEIEDRLGIKRPEKKSASYNSQNIEPALKKAMMVIYNNAFTKESK